MNGVTLIIKMINKNDFLNRISIYIYKYYILKVILIKKNIYVYQNYL